MLNPKKKKRPKNPFETEDSLDALSKSHPKGTQRMSRRKSNDLSSELGIRPISRHRRTTGGTATPRITKPQRGLSVDVSMPGAVRPNSSQDRKSQRNQMQRNMANLAALTFNKGPGSPKGLLSPSAKQMTASINIEGITGVKPERTRRKSIVKGRRGSLLNAAGIVPKGKRVNESLLCIVETCIIKAVRERLCDHHAKESIQGKSHSYKRRLSVTHFLLQKSKNLHKRDNLNLDPSRGLAEIDALDDRKSRRFSRMSAIHNSDGIITKSQQRFDEFNEIASEHPVILSPKNKVTPKGKDYEFVLPKTLNDVVVGLKSAKGVEEAAVVVFATLVAWGEKVLPRGDHWKAIAAICDRSQLVEVFHESVESFEGREFAEVDRNKLNDLLDDCSHVLRSYVLGTKAATATCSKPFILPQIPKLTVVVREVEDFTRSKKVVMFGNQSSMTRYPRGVTMEKDPMTNVWKCSKFWNIFRYVRT